MENPAFKNTTLKILVSLAGAGAVGSLVFLVLETWLAYAQPAGSVPAHFGARHFGGAHYGAALFRFQLSASIAMAVFAGVAIVIYIRLSRNKPSLKKW